MEDGNGEAGQILEHGFADLIVSTCRVGGVCLGLQAPVESAVYDAFLSRLMRSRNIDIHVSK